MPARPRMSLHVNPALGLSVLAACALLFGACGETASPGAAAPGGNGSGASGGTESPAVGGASAASAGSAGGGSGGSGGAAPGGSAGASGGNAATGGDASGGEPTTGGTGATGSGGASSGGNAGTSGTGGSSGGDGGTTGTGGTGTQGGYGGACPDELPEHRSACAGEYRNCSYGDDPRAFCKPRASCSGSLWLVERPICPARESDCPELPLEDQPNFCDTHPRECFYEALSCGCRWVDTDLYRWQCYSSPEGCPAQVPNAGTFCSEDLLDCRYSYSCASWHMRCQGGVWQHIGGSFSGDCQPPLEEEE